MQLDDQRSAMSQMLVSLRFDARDLSEDSPATDSQ